jgi:hypothetical protein
LDAIKVALKSKPITITVEENVDTNAYLMSSAANRLLLQQSLGQAKHREFIEVKPGVNGGNSLQRSSIGWSSRWAMSGLK